RLSACSLSTVGLISIGTSSSLVVAGAADVVVLARCRGRHRGDGQERVAIESAAEERLDAAVAVGPKRDGPFAGGLEAVAAGAPALLPDDVGLAVNRGALVGVNRRRLPARGPARTGGQRSPGRQL